MKRSEVPTCQQWAAFIFFACIKTLKGTNIHWLSEKQHQTGSPRRICAPCGTWLASLSGTTHSRKMAPPAASGPFCSLKGAKFCRCSKHHYIIPSSLSSDQPRGLFGEFYDDCLHLKGRKPIKSFSTDFAICFLYFYMLMSPEQWTVPESMHLKKRSSTETNSVFVISAPFTIMSRFEQWMG